MHELILILDFGSQYTQLIARRIRELNVYCEIYPYNLSIEEIKVKNPKGIVFSGGPMSVYEEGAPIIDKAIFELGVPILGICYGQQIFSHLLGGEVARAVKREYRSEEHTSELQSHSFISYAVFCLKKKKKEQKIEQKK